MLTICKNIINFNGIISFNLRTESLDIYDNILEDLRKKYRKIIEIPLRPCSGFIICCEDKSITLQKNYLPINFNFDPDIMNEIEQRVL